MGNAVVLVFGLPVLLGSIWITYLGLTGNCMEFVLGFTMCAPAMFIWPIMGIPVVAISLYLRKIWAD